MTKELLHGSRDWSEVGAGETGRFRKSACHPRGRVDTRPTKQIRWAQPA